MGTKIHSERILFYTFLHCLSSDQPILIMLTSRLDAYISRYGDFCAHNDNDNDNDSDNDTTDYFTPCACARGNDW